MNEVLIINIDGSILTLPNLKVDGQPKTVQSLLGYLETQRNPSAEGYINNQTHAQIQPSIGTILLDDNDTLYELTRDSLMHPYRILLGSKTVRTTVFVVGRGINPQAQQTSQTSTDHVDQTDPSQTREFEIPLSLYRALNGIYNQAPSGLVIQTLSGYV